MLSEAGVFLQQATAVWEHLIALFSRPISGALIFFKDVWFVFSQARVINLTSQNVYIQKTTLRNAIMRSILTL